ncbi:proton-conducting transporter transmembrane domain-containing protein [Phytohabitans suffuscus]|uniref:proton-conducting transporter transmembrane domain-containing protein n=1 Tax=Phytohabitans suffuscus TaxID=624315 RepID=UPI001566AE7A|nr:proton-conducting transporter membrane subunit [Phytohabitans suffuscus]
MNEVAAALAVAFALAGVGAAAGWAVPARGRSTVAGAATAGVGAAGAAAGLAAVSGTGWQGHLPDLLPLAGVTLSVDALAGWFLLLVGGVAVVVGVYTVGYAGRGGHGPASRTALAVLPVFVAAMLLVPAAGSVSTFLLGWELMAVTSLLLVLAEHRHSPAARTAGLWYAAMTQAGFVAVLVGLAWLAAAAGGESFAAIRAAGPELSPVVSGGVFLLCLAGFASKAGAVPLHPWLPRAHAEAPSHVSALMSAAMVKLGVYGIVRVGFDLLGGGQRWWWLLLGAFGVVSALYGILQAAVATDLKRLLAFSTSENVGLILLGLAAAGLWTDAGEHAAAGVALAAALLHAANHAGFKTLLFCGAGSVLRATGTRDLDELGGLSRRMPATTLLFTVGALGAAALPPGNGFVSEWLLLQALLHRAPEAGMVVTVAAPVAVAVVALTAGVGVATYVKALGTGFLARPRSSAAEQAVESPRGMLAGMGLAALACAGLAVAPAVAAPALDRIAGGLRTGIAPLGGSGVDVRLSGIASTISPLWIGVGVVGLAVGFAGAARAVGRARRRAAAWDCGDGPLTARMEYTATSFAEPLQRVFDNVLAPEQDVDVTHPSESAYLVRSVQYRRRLPDRIEARLYQPMVTAVDRVGRAARGLATGSVHRYLAYMLAALIAVLVAGVIR